MFVNYLGGPSNASFKEHLPEDGQNRWPKYVGYSVYTTINLHNCVYIFGFYFSYYETLHVEMPHLTPRISKLTRNDEAGEVFTVFWCWEDLR